MDDTRARDGHSEDHPPAHDDSVGPRAVSRDDLDHLFHGLPLGIVCQDADGQIISANPAAERILGLTLDQMQGRTSFDPRWRAVDADDHDLPGDRHPAMVALRTGQPQRNVTMGVHRPATADRVWIRVNADPRFRDGQDRPYLVFSTFEDITDEFLARRKLAQSLQRYRAVVETSADGFMVVGAGGAIREVNDAYVERSGYSRDELLAMRIGDLEAVESAEETKRHIERVMREGSDIFETNHRTRSGELWRVEVNVTYWDIDDGGMFCFMRDVRARQRSRELLRTRHRLSVMAAEGSIDAMMQAALDEAELYTGSTIGFFHFVDEDQENLRLTAWSTNTLGQMCTAEGKGMHYPVSEAGVWVEAFHRREPVIHNDYEALPDKRGMPEGHAPVVRELVVPILRGGRVAAILGVGNKAADYAPEDVEIVETIASLVTDLVFRHQAEEARDRQRAFAVTVLDSLGAHMAVLDGRGRVVMVNDAWRRFASESGMQDPSVCHEGVDYLAACRCAAGAGDTDAAAALEGIERVMRGESADFSLDYCCPTPERDRWFEMRAVPLPGGDGGVVVAHTDVTTQHNAAASLAGQVDLLRLIADISGSLISMPTDAIDAAVRDAMARVGACFAAERIVILRLEAGGGGYSPAIEWCAEGAAPISGLTGTITRSRFPWSFAQLERGDPVHITDLDSLPPEAAAEREAMLRTGSRAVVAMPLVWGGRLRGVMALDTTRENLGVTGGEILGFMALASSFAHAYERQEADAALRYSEGRYRSLAETTYDLIWEVDAEARYTYVSPKVQEILGFSPAEVLGRRPFDFMDPPEAERVAIIFDDIRSRCLPIKGLLNFNRHADGHLVALETNGRPLFDAEGGLVGYRGVDRDVTDRLDAENRLRLQAAVSRVFAEAPALADALRGCLATIGEAEGWSFGAVWEVDARQDALRCREWWIPEGSGLEAMAGEMSAATMTRGEGVPGAAWAQGRIVIGDHTSLASSPRCDAARDANMRTCMGIPIQEEGECVGVLEFMWTGDTRPDDSLVELLAAIGRQCGQYISRQRAVDEMQRVVAVAPAVIFTLRRDGDRLRLDWVSENIERMTGYRREDIGADWWAEHVHPEDHDRVAAQIDRLDATGGMSESYRVRCRDGSYIWVQDERSILRNADGGIRQVIGSWADITDRVELEERLRQSQKLEAIGQLAGGVAHDFNNLLTVINGSSEILMMDLPDDGDGAQLLGDIRDAGERASALTRQLLAFSRRQVLEPRIIDLNRVLADLEKMLRRLISEDIALTVQPAPDLPAVKVDPGQMEQVVVNLVVNARDSMGAGGRLAIETRPETLAEPLSSFDADFTPGDYVSLSVRDTGSGMTPEVMSRIFEPFFTTKGQGKGTGLGLATVFGIVKQSGGQIAVTSAEGEGSEFRIYLPVCADAAVESRATVAEKAAPGSERILLVEDDPNVRLFVSRALAARGYHVMAAGSGSEALALAASADRPFDLLLTDVVMPNLSGPQLLREMLAMQPSLRVLFMSGYSDDLIGRHGFTGKQAQLLQKPFSLQDLAAKVRDVLDVG